MTFEWLLHRGAKFETVSQPQPTVERELLTFALVIQHTTAIDLSSKKGNIFLVEILQNQEGGRELI